MTLYVRGDTAAFDALYQRHECALLRFVRRLLGSALSAQAEEVFQDTWLRVVQARDSFDHNRSAWRTWAFTIAHNAAMDRLRASTRMVSMDGLENDTCHHDALQCLQRSLGMTQPSTEDTAFWRAAGAQMLICLDALPAGQRAAFLLHHEDGESVESLARRLELPFETLKSRLRYALKKLRGCMQAFLGEMEART